MSLNIKEYISTGTGTEGSLLIPKTIAAKLWPAVGKHRIGRQFAAIIFGPKDIPGSSIDLDLETANSITVFQIHEGAVVPISVNAYTSTNIKPVKYGCRPFITKEMQEDSKFNLIQNNIAAAGVAIADNEDELILTQLDDANSSISGGSAITNANITRGMQYLEDEDFDPKVMFAGPEVLNDIRNIDTFVEADKLGSREAFVNGLVGIVHGMRLVRFSRNAAPSTTYSKYAYIIDPAHSYCIAEKRPVTVTQYDIHAHDSTGIVITQRIKVENIRTKATVKITTS